MPSQVTFWDNQFIIQCTHCAWMIKAALDNAIKNTLIHIEQQNGHYSFEYSNEGIFEITRKTEVIKPKN